MTDRYRRTRPPQRTGQMTEEAIHLLHAHGWSDIKIASTLKLHNKALVGQILGGHGRLAGERYVGLPGLGIGEGAFDDGTPFPPDRQIAP